MIDSIRRTAGAACVAALAALAVACGPDTGDEAGMEDPQQMETPDAPAGGVAGDPAGMPLDPVGGSGTEGVGRLEQAGDSVRAVVEVSGLPGEGEYPAHIHQGTCEGGGGVAFRFPSVQAGADGTGQTETTLAADALQDGQTYFFQVHGADGSPIACGDIDEGGAG